MSMLPTESDLPLVMRSIIVETHDGPVKITDFIWANTRAFYFCGQQYGISIEFAIEAESMREVIAWMERHE